MDTKNSFSKNTNIVILTGAGISAESGLPTFRASDGLWEGHRVEDVATPEAFMRNPAMVQTFYNERRAGLLDPAIQPNDAHKALAKLEQHWPETNGGRVLTVTQNIDDLHERGGTQDLLHMHGEVLKAFCTNCRDAGGHTNETVEKFDIGKNSTAPSLRAQRSKPLVPQRGEPKAQNHGLPRQACNLPRNDEEAHAVNQKPTNPSGPTTTHPTLPSPRIGLCKINIETKDPCPICTYTGGLRPDIVWFGEMPYYMDEIFEALQNCALFISIGTSGNVYPAAGFVSEALHAGAHTIELNLAPANNASAFHDQVYGPASETVPELVEHLLSS